MSDRYYDLILATLKVHGAVLVRHKTHSVYRFPDGTAWTVAQTPSCPFSYRNNYGDLCSKLGLNDPNRGQPGERRSPAKKAERRRERARLEAAVEVKDWKAQLADVAKRIGL